MKSKLSKNNLNTPPSVSVFSQWKRLNRDSIPELQKRDRFTLFSTLFSYTPNPNCGFCNKTISITSDYLIYLDHSPILLCERCSIEHSTCKNCMALIPFSQYTETIPFCGLCKKNTQCHCCSEFFLVQNISRVSQVPGIFCQKCLTHCSPCIFCKKYNHSVDMQCLACQRSSNPQSIANIADALFKKIICSFPIKIDLSLFSLEHTVFSSSKKFESPTIYPSKSSLQLYSTIYVPLHFFVAKASMIWFSVLIKKSFSIIPSNDLLTFASSFLTKNFLRENSIHIRSCLLPDFWNIISSKEFILFQRLSRELGFPRLLEALQKNSSLEESIFDESL